MAWNEPGGGKDKDPWGQRGADQGPPDLDEAFRKLQSQLAGIFGGRGGLGWFRRPSLNPRICDCGWRFWLVLCCRVSIRSTGTGVVFRFGAVKPDVVLPDCIGIRASSKCQTVNVTQVNSIKHQALMLTQDNIVDGR
jgi:membrane protease subunit HflK